MNKIKIPSNIDTVKVFENFEDNYSHHLSNKSKTEVTNIKDGCLLLIHFLTPNWRYFEMTKKDDYYKRINSEIFNKEYGKTFRVVKDILMDEYLPIIETDGKKYFEGKSTCYKLTDNFFNNTKMQMVEGFGSGYIIKYYSYLNSKKDRFVNLEFLSDHLSKRITMDRTVHLYIKLFFERFDDALSKLNGNHYNLTELVKLRTYLTLKFSSDLRDILDGNYNESESDTCHRFTSVFSSLKRELRYFLRIDGERVVEVDISSSQPYFLNKILCSTFYTNNDVCSFKSIFPEYYKEFLYTDELIKVDSFNLNYVWSNRFVINLTQLKSLYKDSSIKSYIDRFFSRNKKIVCNIEDNNSIVNINNYRSVTNNLEDYSNLSKYIKSYIININKQIYYLYYDISILLQKGINPPPYMCGDTTKLTDLWDFRRIPYHVGFYDYLVIQMKNKFNRSEIKNSIMYFLNYKGDRNKNPILNKMRIMFPNVNRIVEFFLRMKVSSNFDSVKYESPFSLLLQRVESYFFLRVGVKSFCEKFPNEPLITVHDSVIVRESLRKEMESILRSSIEPHMGIPLGVKVDDKSPFDTIDDLVKKYIKKHRRKL